MASRSTTRSSGLVPWLVVSLLVIVVDQLTKVLIASTLTLHEVRSYTSFFDLVLAYNTGAAWNFLANAAGWQRWFFIGLGLLASLFIVVMLKRHSAQRLFCWALALIMGGALGNVIDRLIHGHVVDFIQVHFRESYFPAFNVADSAITIGAGLLILDELLRVRRAR